MGERGDIQKESGERSEERKKGEERRKREWHLAGIKTHNLMSFCSQGVSSPAVPHLLSLVSHYWAEFCDKYQWGLKR